MFILFMFIFNVIFYISLLKSKTHTFIVYQTFSESIKQTTKTQNKYLLSFYKTITIFIFINFISGLFHINGFLFSSKHIPFSFFLIYAFIIYSITHAIHRHGLIKFIKSLYFNVGNSTFMIIISIVITTMKLLTNFIIRPTTLGIRLFMLIMISNAIHETFNGVYDIPILIIINLSKLLIYVIQTYIFVSGISDLFNTIVQEK